MTEKLKPNVIENIATNYEYMHGLHDLHEKLKEILKFGGHNTFYLYKLICEKLGRILKDSVSHFEPELNYDQHRRLVKDIEKNHFITVIKRKRYDDYGNMCITFLVYR